MTDILNYGALNLAMAIGYRTGLFDIMDRLDGPQTAGKIAAQAGLHVRYVTEWLGVMAGGGIVELSKGGEGQNLFALPQHHADFITRRAGNANLGVYTQEIPLLTTCALEPVIKGFYTGSGVGYDHYPQFQAFMTELANAKHREVLVDTFIPAVDDGRLLIRLHTGIRVCDLGCGEGLATILMAQAFPDSRFIGLDISKAAIDIGVAEAARLGLTNIEFVVTDAARMPEMAAYGKAFDYVTAFDAIHDQTCPLEVLKAVRFMMKEDALFSMVDIAAASDMAENVNHPMAPFLYTVSMMHCMPVGLADGGAGLGMMWGKEKAVQMLREAGFTQIDVQEIPEDAFNLHFLCRK
jgi:ubiquinone/menaquinone biosynthesis C-methylase UbiE